MNKDFKTFIIFWFSQSISQLGSAMTSFALIIWVYTKTNSAMSMSLMAFCSYVPYIVVSLFSGEFIDKHKKKTIMLISDSIAAVCSLAIFLIWNMEVLEIWHIYIVNFVIGFMNSFQGPAQSVAIAKIVPYGKISQASGMDSFSANLINIVSPVLAPAIFSFGGLGVVIGVDLVTFIFAFITLFIFIDIPESLNKNGKGKSAFDGCKEGIYFLLKHKGLWYIVLTMAVMNFFSRLTYENILSPMILARSGGNSEILGLVNASLGIGGILGGILVASNIKIKDNIKSIYISAAISFLFGDILMAIGQNGVSWCIAGVIASIPIPFIMAGERVILYKAIPEELQGKVFSVRNAVQYSTIPIGILLGGFLADYIFEPIMKSDKMIVSIFHNIVGQGSGSGMAVMFLCTGILGSVASIAAYKLKEIQKLRDIK